MRVATYTQPAALTRSSLAGVLLLVVTVLLGSTTVLFLSQQLAPATVPLVTLAWLGLYLAAFLGLMLSHGLNWVSWLVRYRLLLVILMLGTLASIGWALDTRLSFERTVHLLGSTLVAIYIGFTVPLLTTLRVLAVTLGALLLASVVVAIGVPALGLEDYAGTMVWRGVFNTKNTLGFWAATAVLLYLTLSDSVNTFAARALCVTMAAVALVLLVFSQSATSLVVMLLAGALSLYVFIAVRFRLGFVRMAGVGILIGGLAAFAVSNISTAELVGRSDDLTGRGEVWAQTWQLIMQRPATGFGYGVLWFPADDTVWIQEMLTDFTWTVHHAHNGFLQVASEIGLPLAVVALLMIAQQLIEIFYCQYQRQQAGVLFVLAFSVAYLVSNFSEARFLVNRELFWILFIALPISMLRQINLIAAPSSVAAGAAGRDGGGASAAVPWAGGGPATNSPGHGAAAAGAANAGGVARAGRTRARPVAARALDPRGFDVGGEGAAASASDGALAVTARSESPWIALAAEQRRREAERRAAEAAADAPIPGDTSGDADPSLADTQQLVGSDARDESWNEADFDATVEALTLSDADIDLGGEVVAAAYRGGTAGTGEAPAGDGTDRAPAVTGTTAVGASVVATGPASDAADLLARFDADDAWSVDDALRTLDTDGVDGFDRAFDPASIDEMFGDDLPGDDRVIAFDPPERLPRTRR